MRRGNADGGGGGEKGGGADGGGGSSRTALGGEKRERESRLGRGGEGRGGAREEKGFQSFTDFGGGLISPFFGQMEDDGNGHSFL